MKELRIVARIYNNRLRERREATGLTACAFAASIGVQPTTYCAFEAMKKSPIDTRFNRWTKTAARIAEAFQVPPSELWPEGSRHLRAVQVERRLDAEEVAAMSLSSSETPFGLLAAAEERAAISDAIRTLDFREREVVERRCGFNGEPQTQATIAEAIGCSTPRVAQLERRAIRKLEAVLRRSPEVGQ